MDTRNLLLVQALDAATRTFEPQRQILARLIFFVRLQGDGVMAFFAFAQGFKSPGQRRLAKQKDVRACFRCPRSQTQQGLHRSASQALGIIHQQIDFLPRQSQLDYLRHDAIEIGVLTVECLSDLRQQRTGVHSALRVTTTLCTACLLLLATSAWRSNVLPLPSGPVTNNSNWL